MLDQHKQALVDHHVMLIENIRGQIAELFEQLVNRKVITTRQREEFENNNARAAQVTTLLSHLPTCNDEAFKELCESLRAIRRVDIAQKLEDTAGAIGGASVAAEAGAIGGASVAAEDTVGAKAGAIGSPSVADEDRRKRFRKILLDNREQLVQELNPKVGLLDCLLQDRVVDMRMKNKLTEKCNKEDQASELLDYMYDRPLKDMETFPRSLRKNNQPHLADLFQ